MTKKRSLIFLGVGILFLLYAIFGRYLVLPGYLAGLETGGETLEGAAQIASPLESSTLPLMGVCVQAGNLLHHPWCSRSN